MSRRISIASLLILGLLVVEGIAPSQAQGVWIWTPKSRRWVNPKYAAKDSPRAQMDWAVGFFESRNYPRAAKEFLRLLQAFPRSELAPEALYLAGVSYELLNRPSEAFATYKRLVEVYPFSPRFKEAIEREFAIGESFFSGKRLKLLGPVSLPSLDKAIEIYQHVVDQAPYGEYGALAHFRLGECYRKQQRFEEASRAFQKVIQEYPNSDWVEKAQFNVAFCAHRLSLKPSYDQSATDEAIAWFEEFIQHHPESDLIPEARDSLRQLREFKAQGLYEIAHFYEIQGSPASALIYYRQIAERYADSTEAAKALAKVTELERTSVGKQ